jgi:hypothetical protein
MPTELTLTPQEQSDLATLNGKMSHVKDAVAGVVKEFHPGFFLHGEGGTGKSFAIVEHLKTLRASYVFHNSRMTGRGLVDALERAPSSIHLVEDAETLLDDRRAWGVLRSALWSQSRARPMVREITWTAYKTQIRFPFVGGVIIISQRNLGVNKPEVRAIKTRVGCYHIDLTSREVKALMKSICLGGFTFGQDYMAPQECWEVASYIIDKLSVLNRPLDLRLLMNGFRDFLQHKTGNSANHWMVLLEGRMAEQVLYRGRDDQKSEEAHIALRIHKKHLPIKRKIKLWTKETGFGQSAYYEALKRLRARG